MDILCLDIGGTSTRAAIVCKNGIKNKIVKKTPFSKKDEMVNQSVTLVKELFNINSIKAISIGCAGPVMKSIMQGSEPMGITDNVNFKNEINKFFKIPVYVENDLQMAIRAERKYGFGKGIKNFVIVSLSTGIGVAVLKNNMIMEGRIEIGHNIIDNNKKFYISSSIGNSGSWVSQASGSAIKSYLEKNEENTSIESFFKKPDKDFLNHIVEINSHGFAQIIHAYDPEIIIIMGSLGINQFEKIIPKSSNIKKKCLLRPIPNIIKSRLGDDVGILGAYEFALEKLVNFNA
tara:strand:- start:3080 stop:3949 length:870 start_codon:yes stop_codon:yes gene_type:complete